jgi:hypothetical protein
LKFSKVNTQFPGDEKRPGQFSQNVPETPGGCGTDIIFSQVFKTPLILLIIISSLAHSALNKQSFYLFGRVSGKMMLQKETFVPAVFFIDTLQSFPYPD